MRVHVFPNVSNRLAYYHQSYFAIGLRTFVRTHARDFDVAHLHACRNWPGVVAADELRRASVPYVLQPNGTAPRLERRRWAKRVFDAVAGDRVMRGAATVIAVTHAERRQFDALDVTPARVAIVPNPIDLDEFDAPIVRGRFRARAGIDGAAPLVLFLGKLTPRKRVDVLLRAVPALTIADARVVVAGNDMGSERGLRALAHALHLETRVTFTGLLTGRERLDALADADVVVYPSEDEIFGLVPVEAILCGTPVVVSNDSGCGEVIDATGGGLTVPVGDATALARAIDDVLRDREQWRQRAADAALRARRVYDANAVAARLVEVYTSAIDPERAVA